MKSIFLQICGQSGKGENSTQAKFMQFLMTLLIILSAIAPGMGLGYPAIVSQWFIRDKILTPDQVSWFASVTSIACPFGGLIASYLTDKIGRKGTIVVTDIIAIIQWAFIGFSSKDNNQKLFVQLIIARVLTGLALGMIATPGSMYAAEVCIPTLRGRLSIMPAFMLALGALTIYLLENIIDGDFRMVAFYALGITLATLVLCFIAPDTPVYLVMSNKLGSARSTLSLLRNLPEDDKRIDAEIQRIQEAGKRPPQSSRFALLLDFTKPELYKPFIIMLTFITIQQLSGIYVIFIFTAQFCLEAGVKLNEFIATDVVGLIRCVATLCVGFLSERFGRKPVVTISSAGMFISMVGLSVFSFLKITDDSLDWIPTVLLFIYTFTGTLGVFTLALSMLAEVYPQKTRSLAVGISLSYCFGFSFFTIKYFSTVFETFGSGWVFSFHAAIAFIGILFSLFILPETNGKTFQEIEDYFKK